MSDYKLLSVTEMKKLDKNKLIVALTDAQKEIADLNGLIHNLKMDIEQHQSTIMQLEEAYATPTMQETKADNLALHTRLYSQSYNNPFMGLSAKGGELYNRYACDFIVEEGVLKFKVRTMTSVGVIEDRIVSPIKESSLILNRKQLGEIKLNGLESFVREYFGFIDIVNNKNEIPFSKYTFV